MASLKIVLLIESNVLNRNVSSPYKYYGERLWETIETIIHELHYSYETVELNKLHFQENESVNKFLNADIVIMDVTNQDCQGTYMYHKGTRENVDCMDDIVLIQTSDVENDNTIQYVKTTCLIKHLIEYRYDEEKYKFYDVTKQSTNSSISLKTSLTFILREAANNMRKGLSNRYFNRLEKRKSVVQDTIAEREYIWKNICEEILVENNQEYATMKLITQLMYAFRDIQDYQSMIAFSERCEQNRIISKKIQNNIRISYLTAFARSRRNQDDDRKKALHILESLCQTKRTEIELSNDITCLSGRIYKDIYTESNCEDTLALEKAIEWYRRGFAASPNIYAGINLLFCLAITTVDLRKNREACKIIMQLNALLGKKARSIKDFSDYWDVAAYFELNAVQHEWLKACLCALHMYLLNPPIWHLKSTINDLVILHKATSLREQSKVTTTTDENIYSFWIDFFTDGINSNSTIPEERELPAQVPILLWENYEQSDETTVNSIYIEADLQLNFHTDDEPETLIIRTLKQQNQLHVNDLVKTIDMNFIRSIINVKHDNRSIFLYAYENVEPFSSVELHIYFSSAERRTAFNEKMSKYRVEIPIPESRPEIDLEFVRDQQGQRISLGQGTYGKVYVAQDCKNWKKYAVKEIPMRNPTYRDDLENEIKILSTLKHKNIVSYYGTAIDSSRKPAIFQVIMEYIDGGNLSKHISQYGKFPEEIIISYTRQLLEGVQYLHENNILHRDIKSANILLNSRGDIKIVDFGTSKRLTGLHLCREESVGTLQYMSPQVVLVPTTGYGSEVDIWSVGCTVVEMATGKRPFHDAENRYRLVYKLGIDKQPPEIPADLSDTAKDFIAQCFETTQKRPAAKDLLNHPFLNAPSQEASSNSFGDRTDSAIRFSSSSSSLNRGSSEETGMSFEPARIFQAQVSIDDRRRSDLANILRDTENREALISQWIYLIGQRRETEILNTEKLLILLNGICDYLDNGHEDSLKNALDQIDARTTMDIDLRIDWERSFYLFITATNNVLSSRNVLPPHLLFAVDNIIRRIAEHLVGLIRPDFRPAEHNMIPLSPILDSQSRPLSTNSWEEMNNDEATNLYQQYRILAEQNRERMYQLIELDNANNIKLTELIDNQRNNSSSKPVEFFLPVESSTIPEGTNFLMIPPIQQTNRNYITPSISVSKVIKYSRELLEVEQEHERLLKEITENRTRINQTLHSLGASIRTKTFKRNINILIASLTSILPSITMIEYNNVEIITFDDDCACISQLLSINDKLIYLVVPVSLADFVVPLIHDHICIECIYLYQDSYDKDSMDWMKDYSKVYGSGSSIDLLVKLIKEDIDSIMKRGSRLATSEALLTELCTKTTSTGIPASINDALEDDMDALRIFILHLNHRRPFDLADKKIRIDEFYDIDKCITSIKDNTSTTVFLIISTSTFNDILSVFELDAIHAVYIVTDLESNEQIQTMSTYSKLSGIFALEEDLFAQLMADICFHRQIRVHTPIISVFKIESSILEKLTEHQIDFLFFQLFSGILSQLPTQSTTGVGSDITGIDWQLFRLVEANMTISTLLKQFNTSTLQGSVSKLNKINKHIMSLAQNVGLSSATVYRVQIVSKNDLNMLRSNSNALLAIHSFILASHSFKSVAKICRLAVDNQLTVVLFELKLLDKASVAHLDSYTVVFSLGTLFRLVSIESAPDGVWRAQLEVANSSMQRIKDQLQIEIGVQLTWFTFGNYLTTFKRFDAAKKYYEYLLLVLSPNHPSRASIYNNIGLMHSEMYNDKEALKWFDQSLNFKIKELPMQIEEKNLSIMNSLPPQFSSNDRILTLAKMAEINYHQGELKKSLDCYRQGLEIADNASWRQFFQAKVLALLSPTPDSET